ncbi:hypothetical protein N0V88_000704 [Collariella sp. IMI 366227]|nr:hypothetical protein N0V88_000704 [Collariella sp. IMI 366227]
MTHWHNSKVPLDPKHVPKAKGYFAAKRHQQFMSDTIAYSASLSGASGKNIEPESIVVQNLLAKLKIPTRAKEQTPRTKKEPPKSNKQKALEYGKALQLEKLAIKSHSVVAIWKERCLEFDKQPLLFRRYLRAEKYASNLSSANWQIIGAEVLLYLGDVLFDSAPDPRVPSFHPDAWQRKVLDAIDANKSVLAVAPTSASKTFISFYAMKKVLQANDDDILVYVAPTKALVNQIAAEVQARFSKHYGNRAGKSVWAIHTRDYRVNSAKGCQVLVTVPSILQILLLAPANAKRPNDWSNRIRPPCPIIALSATIANPGEFKAWLEQSQNTKGFELEMIVHSSRYSDLRKFIHDPAPTVSEFTGLAPVERLPLPGLDSELLGVDNTSPFLLVHPVASIVDKNRDTLNDTSLESRDCLSLWKCMKKHQTPQYPLSLNLDPEKALPEEVQKSDVVKWEKRLKDQLGEWMVDPKSPFDAVRQELRGHRYSYLADSYSPKTGLSSGQPYVETSEKWPEVSSRSVFSLVTDLRTCGALPAILFNYDRKECEAIVTQLFTVLVNAESHHRVTSAAWKAKLSEYEAWKRAREAAGAKSAKKAANPKNGGRRGDDDRQGKVHLEREAASLETGKWETYDPDAALAQFSFADRTKITSEELEERLREIHRDSVREPFIDALRRGVAVHHAGMNRHYRQAVEMLFRKGFLTVVVATGTLAMGINMPCKTVVFTGDSIYLTALNYRQASGRAGRRGFDVLGNVVFHDMPPQRALEIMSARLPDLRGQFPTSATLILRLFILLHGTNNSDFADGAVRSLLTQNRLYMGGPAAKMSIAHHLRFSIDYLRRQHLLSATGTPLNFAGLVGHLYYTESAAFAFHALLQEGYFHTLCAPFSNHMSAAAWRALSLELVLTLSHLFLRRPTTLPPLPEHARAILAAHNAQTLAIFRAYLTPTTIRSPFAALSGSTDFDFATPSELCETARAGSAAGGECRAGVELGQVELVLAGFLQTRRRGGAGEENGVGGAEVWFVLREFELVLAAGGEFEGFLRPGEEEGEEGGWGEDWEEEGREMEEEVQKKVVVEKKKKKKVVVDSWEEEVSEEDEEEEEEADGQAESVPSWDRDGDGQSLVKVYKAFRKVEQEFKALFKKMWA